MCLHCLIIAFQISTVIAASLEDSPDVQQSVAHRAWSDFMTSCVSASHKERRPVGIAISPNDQLLVIKLGSYGLVRPLDEIESVAKTFTSSSAATGPITLEGLFASQHLHSIGFDGVSSLHLLMNCLSRISAMVRTLLTPSSSPLLV